MKFYQKAIIKATGCKPEETESIEDIMRNDIFHSTLDWQTKRQFNKGAKEAYEIFKAIQSLKAKHGSQWYNHI